MSLFLQNVHFYPSILLFIFFLKNPWPNDRLSTRWVAEISNTLKEESVFGRTFPDSTKPQNFWKGGRGGDFILAPQGRPTNLSLFLSSLLLLLLLFLLLLRIFLLIIHSFIFRTATATAWWRRWRRTGRWWRAIIRWTFTFVISIVIFFFGTNRQLLFWMFTILWNVKNRVKVFIRLISENKVENQIVIVPNFLRILIKIAKINSCDKRIDKLYSQKNLNFTKYYILCYQFLNAF